jgi:hypothetical protein
MVQLFELAIQFVRSVKIADNEEGIKEVKKKKGLDALLFVYLHCLLEAQLFVYLSKPFFFLFLLSNMK